METIKNIEGAKPKSINIIAIHGIFADKKTYEKIKKSADTIITTNTIENIHSKIDVSGLIASGLGKPKIFK